MRAEAVPAESSPQARAQHHRVLCVVDSAGRPGCRRYVFDAFSERGNGGRDDFQELGGLPAELGQRPGEYLQRGGRVLYGAGSPPLGSGGVGECTHRDHRALG
ncbi:hypothetical protein OG594_44435 [Streptomyces sp. NBC_01214]|uniref:hypothetical protein n=1 Tax=Streptomyces sp. NBC_01214 TaxID=2903777 RepID=UPI0022533320|nr:hypothetical protein [Streptomyces sp. NBC_01214]MCX4808556.1 hypothetical protein [Streptomyces sp. NBC_01214]